MLAGQFPPSGLTGQSRRANILGTAALAFSGTWSSVNANKTKQRSYLRPGTGLVGAMARLACPGPAAFYQWQAGVRQGLAPLGWSPLDLQADDGMGIRLTKPAREE